MVDISCGALVFSFTGQGSGRQPWFTRQNKIEKNWVSEMQLLDNNIIIIIIAENGSF